MNIGNANVYTDFSGLNSLRLQAKENPNEAAREVAQQFESIFVGMVMKSMRDASPKEGFFNSDQMAAYKDMFDKQLAVDLSAKGGFGLADIIERQIATNSAFTSANTTDSNTASTAQASLIALNNEKENG